MHILNVPINNKRVYFFFGVRERSLALLFTPSGSGEEAVAGEAAGLFDLAERLLGVDERPLAGFDEVSDQITDVSAQARALVLPV